MNARTFDKQATAGVTGYLARHGLAPKEFRMTALRWGRCEHFRLYHRGTLVAQLTGRPAVLRWMRESTREEALEIERASNEQRRRDAIQQETGW